MLLEIIYKKLWILSILFYNNQWKSAVSSKFKIYQSNHSSHEQWRLLQILIPKIIIKKLFHYIKKLIYNFLKYNQYSISENDILIYYYIYQKYIFKDFKDWFIRFQFKLKSHKKLWKQNKNITITFFFQKIWY